MKLYEVYNYPLEYVTKKLELFSDNDILNQAEYTLEKLNNMLEDRKSKAIKEKISQTFIKNFSLTNSYVKDYRLINSIGVSLLNDKTLFTAVEECLIETLKNIEFASRIPIREITKEYFRILDKQGTRLNLILRNTNRKLFSFKIKNEKTSIEGLTKNKSVRDKFLFFAKIYYREIFDRNDFFEVEDIRDLLKTTRENFLYSRKEILEIIKSEFLSDPDIRFEKLFSNI